jgi:hypothetical protein
MDVEIGTIQIPHVNTSIVKYAYTRTSWLELRENDNKQFGIKTTNQQSYRHSLIHYS